MKKFILKTNEWYEGLKFPFGGLFYLFLVFLPFITLHKIFPEKAILPLIWILLVIFWRASYSILRK